MPWWDFRRVLIVALAVLESSRMLPARKRGAALLAHAALLLLLFAAAAPWLRSHAKQAAAR